MTNEEIFATVIIFALGGLVAHLTMVKHRLESEIRRLKMQR